MDISHLFRKYPELQELFILLKTEFEKAHCLPEQTILDDVDLRKMLNVSARTTAEWRTKRLITHKKVVGKMYYKLSDVLAFLDKYTVESDTRNIKIKL